MNIDKLLTGQWDPSLGKLQGCIEELIVDREERVPSEIRNFARNCMKPQPVATWDFLIEMIYADRENCGPILLQIAAAGAVDFVRSNFMNKADRMEVLSLIFKRAAGVRTPEGTQWPAPDDDPDIDIRFAPEPEIEGDIDDL